MKKITVTLVAIIALIIAVSIAATGGSSDNDNAATKGDTSDMTTSQEQALESAKSYLDSSGFSRAGLIHQLSAKAGEGFSKKDATFAVNHLKVDWNAEAAESAQTYLDMGGFSRSGLIHQLESKAGEGFTHAQAVYAVNKVGL